MVGKNTNVDGGYAWVVLGALFTVDLLIGMLWTTVGLLTTAIVLEMEEDITRASAVGSTLLGTSTLFGPVSGLLHDRMGHRWTGVISGVLMLVGLTSASFCSSTTGLICTFGFVTGLGASLGTNLSGVVPGSYFKKKLSIAYGIIQVGGGCGLFFVGPLVLFLLDKYQLSGTLLILGGIMFHVSLAGALIRPNTIIEVEEEEVEPESKSSSVDADAEVRDGSGSVMRVAERRDEAPFRPKATIGNKGDEIEVESKVKGENKALTTFQKSCRIQDDSFLVPNEMQIDNGSVPVSGSDVVSKSEDVAYPNVKTFNENVTLDSAKYHRKSSKFDKKEFHNDQAAFEPLMKSKLPEERGFCFERCSKLIVSQLKTVSLVLRNNGFYIYLLSSVFWTLGDSSSMLHLPNYAESKGTTPSQVSNLLTGMGVTVIISSILSGFAVSDPVIGNILLNFGCLGMAGMLTVLFPLFSHSYLLQMVYSTLYCVYSQAPYTLAGPICIQLVGVTNLGLGYGLSAFFTGLGYLFGPPIASLLYESSGLYDISYVFAGCCLLVAAFLIALVPMFEKQEAEIETAI